MALFRDRTTEELKAQRDGRLSLIGKLTGRRDEENRQAIREITAVLARRGQRDR